MADGRLARSHGRGGLAGAFGPMHQLSVKASTALALLLLQTGQLEQAATIYRIHGELGPQPHTSRLLSRMRGRWRGCSASAVRRRMRRWWGECSACRRV
eukprot:4967631-Prymnesium_polylepis.2